MPSDIPDYLPAVTKTPVTQAVHLATVENLPSQQAMARVAEDVFEIVTTIEPPSHLRQPHTFQLSPVDQDVMSAWVAMNLDRDVIRSATEGEIKVYTPYFVVHEKEG
eukprot:Lankesteria_metandrocarpae@DN9265_c0_g1_i1.p1